VKVDEKGITVGCSEKGKGIQRHEARTGAWEGCERWTRNRAMQWGTGELRWGGFAEESGRMRDCRYFHKRGNNKIKTLERGSTTDFGGGAALQ